MSKAVSAAVASARDGWLSGDDYDEIKWPEVVSAVNEVLPDARPWSTSQWRWVARPV